MKERSSHGLARSASASRWSAAASATVLLVAATPAGAASTTLIEAATASAVVHARARTIIASATVGVGLGSAWFDEDALATNVVWVGIRGSLVARGTGKLDKCTILTRLVVS